MELLLLSAPSTSLPSSLSSSSTRKTSLLNHPYLSGKNSVTFPIIKRCVDARKFKCPHFRAKALAQSVQASTTSDSVTTDAISQGISSKDEHVVFVAGATGKVGSRTVRELLKLGFQVRAGVRSAQRAETLVQGVQQLKIDGGASAVEKLEIVECDLERDGIESAIGNASVVICCIGASEKEVFDITGPYRIDYQATKNLIDAATVAGVNHFILLTSLGTNKIGFPAAILNLFWGVLIWKRKAEEALIASGLPYTIVRPGGMERPTDAYKETHNIFLAKEDTLFGGQVSNLQVAELIAFMTKNRDLSYCKVVEVIAETTTPLTPFAELLSKLPSQRMETSSTMTKPQSARKVDAATSTVIKEPTQKKVMTPSPYILYKDSKTTSSTPTPSTSQGSTKDVNAQEPITKPVPSNSEVSSPEPVKSASDKESSLENIQNSGTLSTYIAYDDLKPPTSPTPPASSGNNEHPNVVEAAPEPTIAASQGNVSGLTTSATESKLASLKVQEMKPLSPFFVYEDMKPPTSPTPTFSAYKSGSVARKIENQAAPLSFGGVAVAEKTPSKLVENELPNVPTQKTSHLSPYPVYDELKPPASPSPSAPTVSPDLTSTTDPRSQLVPEKETSKDQAAASNKVEEKTSIEPKPRPLSPFIVYDDLKPPASPSPAAPTLSPVLVSTSDAASQLVPKQETSTEQAASSDTVEHLSESKPRPLSPFTMYEDLKPPSSPTPSPNKC